MNDFTISDTQPPLASSAPASPRQPPLAPETQTTGLIVSDKQPKMANFDQLVQQTAQKHGVDPAFALGIHHSEYSPKRWTSPAGAAGPMQLIPSTFKAMAKKLGIKNPNINDPAQNIEAGVAYLKDQLGTFKGNKALAAAAYNAGPGAVIAHGGVPDFPETQKYVRQVMKAAGQDSYLPVTENPNLKQAIMTPKAGPAPMGVDAGVQVPGEQERQGRQATTQDALQFAQAPHLLPKYPLNVSNGQVSIGAREGLAHEAGKYGSILASSFPVQAASVLQTILPGLGSDKKKSVLGLLPREQQARIIQDNAEKGMGVSDAPPPQGLLQTLERATGQSLPGLGEAALLGKGLSALGEGALKLPGVMDALKSLPMEAAASLAEKYPWLNHLGGAAKSAATFGTMGALESRNPGKQAVQGAVTGALLGPTENLSWPSRAAAGAGIFGTGEAITNPKATPTDIASQAILGGAFNAIGGGKGKEPEAKTQAKLDRYIDERFAKALTPRVEGKRRFGKIDDWDKSLRNVVKNIVLDSKDGKLELGSKEDPAKLPRNALELSQAIEQQFWKLAEENRADMAKAGKDTTIDPKILANSMRKRVSELENLTSPGIKPAAGYARDFLDAIEKHGPYTLDSLQKEIAAFNNNSNARSYYQNANPDTERNVKTDEVFASAARDALYKSVEGEAGPGFKQRRMLMRDIKNVEVDIAKKAVVNFRQPEKGFWDVSDPLIVMHAARGLATGDLVSVGASLASKASAIWNKMKTNRDRIIRTSFKTLNKKMSARPASPPKTDFVPKTIDKTPRPGLSERGRPGLGAAKESARTVVPERFDENGKPIPNKRKPFNVVPTKDYIEQTQKTRLRNPGSGTAEESSRAFLKVENRTEGRTGPQSGGPGISVATRPNVAAGIKPVEREVPPQAKSIMDRAKEAAERKKKADAEAKRAARRKETVRLLREKFKKNKPSD